MYEIRHYITPAGRDVYAEWRQHLRDVTAQIAIDRRVNRVADGNFGDHKHISDGVYELRIDMGPGFRVYYAIEGRQVVLLITGGDKSTQRKDIEKACAYWADWQERVRKARKADESEY